MSIELLVEAIHASPIRLSLCICGAGAGAIARLTQVAECSRTLLGADVLYHRAATHHALDGLPQHIVSAAAARRLAQHAFHKSRRIAAAEACEAGASHQRVRPAQLLFGVGATSAIQTSRVRHSSDQVFVSVWGGALHVDKTQTLTSTLSGTTRSSSSSSSGDDDGDAVSGTVFDYHMNMPDTFDRAAQDQQVELLVLHAIAETVTRCTPGEGRLVHHSNGRVYPPALLNLLLPTQSPASEGSAASHSSPRLCSVPSRSGPLRVALDVAHEVAEAVDSVLSYSAPPGGPEDVCVLWNQHGELRRSGRLPYDTEAEEGASTVATATPSAVGAVPSSGSATDTSGCARRPLRLLYPGSFNPLHYGHTELVAAAVRVLRRHLHNSSSQNSSGCEPQRHTEIPVQVTYEIAVKVVDKGSISSEDVQRRVGQFLQRGERVAVTNAKLFISKAKLFPGHGFLIGMDTAVRVLDAQHYISDITNSTAEGAAVDPAVAETAMVTALLRDIGDRGCYFVVGGRKTSDAAGWQDLSMLAIPPSIRHLFVGIPPEDFRVDVSSTELRAKRRGV